MIYLFLGKDGFTKRQAIKDLQLAIPGAELVTLDAPETEQDILREAAGASLFSNNKLVLVRSALSKFDSAALIDALAQSTDTIVFDEESLDKRKKETKALLADTRITVREFAIPTEAIFDSWISARAKEYGFSFASGALRHFAERLGDDGRSDLDYDLFQADNELQKLAAYADGGSITRADIDALIVESYDEDIFIVTNAIADRKQTAAMKAIANFLERVPGADEKSKIINLSAILAEQFRGMYAFGSLVARGAGDAEIAEVTGFTPGRIFVYKKLAKSFTSQALREALRKFEALDAEVKTSTGPASLQFYMIFQGLMK
jgi:DNA polymerase III delta subunit